MDKTYNRTWRDKFDTEVSAHLLKYLNMLGITYDEQTNSYYFDGLKLRESYFEENMFVSSGGCEDDYWDCVCLNSSETHLPVGEIYNNGTVAYYGKRGVESEKVSFTEDNGVCRVKYTPGNREEDIALCLVVSQDVLGNIMIAFGELDVIHIKIGETIGTAQEYLDMLKESVKKVLGKNAKWPIIELMFSDPRITGVLNTLIQSMAPDIDTAFTKNVEASYNEYCENLLKSMYQLGDKFLADLRKFEEQRDACKRAQVCKKKNN